MRPIVFTDIETVPKYPTYFDLPEAGKQSYAKKFGKTDEVQNFAGAIKAGSKVPDLSLQAALSAHYDNNASYHPEYSEVACIVVGMVDTIKTVGQPDKDRLIIKGFKGTEKEILTSFKNFLDSEKLGVNTILCAHNGKKFDYPFICKRMVINGMPLPLCLQIEGKKPWEIPHLDTMEMWRFTDPSSYVSLITLCYVFGIETPKDDMDGSMVHAAFRAGDIDGIVRYCMKDVHALVNVFRKMRLLEVIPEFIISTKAY